MKARTKLLLPLALLVLAFTAFLYGLWLPDYTREVRQRAVAVQTAYLRALAPALVEPLFKGELSAVYEVLDAQLDLHPHGWDWCCATGPRDVSTLSQNPHRRRPRCWC